jgi:transposase
MEPFGEETSEQLEFIPHRAQVIRHICKKYHCPHCEGHLTTAAKPPQPIPKSMASASLPAHIVISRYADGLSLYRQCKIFSRIGFNA